MARYTIRDLRILVAEANRKYPRTKPNHKGNFDRYLIDGSYGGYQVCEYDEDPKCSGVRSITHGFPSSRECAEEFRQYLWKYMD